MYEAACKLGLEGIVSKRLTAPYRSGPCKGAQSQVDSLSADQRGQKKFRVIDI